MCKRNISNPLFIYFKDEISGLLKKKKTAIYFIFAEIVMCIVFLLLLFFDRKFGGFLEAYAIGYPSILLAFKFFMQKKIFIDTSDIKVISTAPLILWVEHLALLFAFALSAIFSNQLQGLSLFVPTAFTVIFVLVIFAAMIPFINLWIFKNGRKL